MIYAVVAKSILALTEVDRVGMNKANESLREIHWSIGRSIEKKKENQTKKFTQDFISFKYLSVFNVNFYLFKFFKKTAKIFFSIFGFSFNSNIKFLGGM